MQGALHTLSRMHTKAAMWRLPESEGRRIYEVIGHASWIHSPR